MRCRLLALRDISLQRNDLSLSGAKRTLAPGLPNEFMSSRPSHVIRTLRTKITCLKPPRTTRQLQFQTDMARFCGLFI